MAGRMVRRAGVSLIFVLSAPVAFAAPPLPKAAPLLDLADSLFGAFGVPFILLTATVAIGTSINATFMIYARFLYAMGRTGVLPKALGRVHPRFRTPHFALTAAFATCCLGLFLPSGLIFLFLAVNIPTLLKYAANALAALRLLEREPALYERAAFKPPRRALIVICYASVIAAIAIIGVGLSADWRPYVLLGGWAVIGAVYYALRGRSAATARLPD
ncbi:MAG: amino acid permease [Alphaproteobacteria bacterium]|nr:amino acid permease [Alphaproteobacteria bacterium]